MLKNILRLKGVQKLEKSILKAINGGHNGDGVSSGFGCHDSNQCESDEDCLCGSCISIYDEDGGC
ncbi:hypothetical protein GTQ40_03585 [Flavobacteriaceae bacterium R38]|nr:hypothetical protein [Flavobacteriaceae bacterium R38]